MTPVVTIAVPTNEVAGMIVGDEGSERKAFTDTVIKHQQLGLQRASSIQVISLYDIHSYSFLANKDGILLFHYHV